MNHPNILIVEDNQANFAVLDYLLRAHGFHVLAAGNGREALDVLARELVDLVLCDMQMPVMDGYEFARCTRANPRYARLPLLAVTASSMAGDRTRVLAAGFDDYFSKPIDPETFVDAMEHHLPPALRRAR